MHQKIIFFDIDGTILSHRNYTISNSTIDAIQKARANGHLAFINTGRTYSAIDKAIKEVGFDGYVCGCGTYITYNSTVLLHKAIDVHMRHLIMQDIRALKLDAVLEGTHAIYFDVQTRNSQLNSIREMYQKNLLRLSDWEDPDIDYDKFCIWVNSIEAAEIFQDKYKNSLEFINRENQFLEVIPKGYSKATGIEYLLQYLEIPYENAYALGDSANDYTMLKYVKHSIGMANSEELIRDLVSFITKDVDEGGVEYALRHFQII